jgi:hydroxymethylbilane synthase
VNERETLLCLRAEREFLNRLHGDCNFPVGVHATIRDGKMKLRAQLFQGESPAPLEGEVEGDADEAERLAADLLDGLRA